MSQYPIESIANGGQFQRGVLSGLVIAYEGLVGGPQAATADVRIVAANALLKRMYAELNKP